MTRESVVSVCEFEIIAYSVEWVVGDCNRWVVLERLLRYRVGLIGGIRSGRG